MIKWEKTKWGTVWKWEWDWWIEFKNRRSRPVRILGNLLLAAVLLALIYVLNGSPDANLLQAFRREEERNLIGPGNILGTVSVEESIGYDRLLLAETDNGVILYCYNDGNFSLFGKRRQSTLEGTMIYREKGEFVTVMAAPCYFVHRFYDGAALPVILFDDCPKAVRAELDLYLNANNYGLGDSTWNIEARRESGGYFLFELKAVSDDQLQFEVDATSIVNLGKMFESGAGFADGFPATVRLYDKADNLILEEDITVHSDGSAAHMKNQ